MSSRISLFVRKEVAKRAGFRCEYCLLHEADSFLPFQIDHIVAIKHGGGDELINLAYACPHCNQSKGTDLVTFLKSYGDLVTIFNPRIQKWQDHFQVENGLIIPVSRIGQATEKLLRLNLSERVSHRRILMESGSYP